MKGLERRNNSNMCDNEENSNEIEGSDIVAATVEFSSQFNIFIYILFLVFTLLIVAYAVFLTYRLVSKGRDTISTVNLNQGYTPVALG